MCRRAWSILETASDSARLQHGSWRKARGGWSGREGLGQDGRDHAEHRGFSSGPHAPHWSLTALASPQSLKESVFQWSQYCKYEELHINTWGSIFSREADIWAHIYSRSRQIIVPGVKAASLIHQSPAPRKMYTCAARSRPLPSPGLLSPVGTRACYACGRQKPRQRSEERH